MHYLLIVLLHLGFSMHDVQIATFTISDQHEALIIDVVIEKEDLAEVLGQEIVDRSIYEYLSNHLIIRVDGSQHELRCSDNMIKDKHIHIRATIAGASVSPKSIEIDNTCLLDIKGHSNIMRFRIADQERDFLMNKDRTSIELSF